MSDSKVDQIARAVLYEGYVLYPYRPSVKTHQRWTFGGVFPQAYSQSHSESDPSAMQSQCLLKVTPSTTIYITLRFLHLTDRTVEQAPAFEPVPSLRVGDTDVQSWQEAVEREVVIDQISLKEMSTHRQRRSFAFRASREVEVLRDESKVVGRLVREQQPVQGAIELDAIELAADLIQLSIRVVNETPIDPRLERDQAILSSFASTHFVLRATDGEFLSLTDPLAALSEVAGRCQNVGCWPVLVGEPNQTDTLLVSPIILPDYPQIADESPGDLFDGCEIDEILTLRILTLTDEEKRAVAGVDQRAKQLLARTETLARDQLASLHGAMRPSHPAAWEQAT